MKAKDFKEILNKKLLDKLNPLGFKLIKSRELFQRKSENNINNIYIYPTCYSDYFSIEIYCYYDNLEVNRILKNNYPNVGKLINKGIIGGDCKQICEKLFKKKWILPYSEIIHKKDESIDQLCDAIIFLYQEYIIPFFNLFNTNLKSVHQTLNEFDINTTGFGINYENRLLKGLIVAKLNDLSIQKTKELADNYENQIKIKKLPYLKQFTELRRNLGIENGSC